MLTDAWGKKKSKEMKSLISIHHDVSMWSCVADMGKNIYFPISKIGRIWSYARPLQYH